jgi:hypothetical protein
MIGFPFNGRNCFLISPPIRVPDPAAGTIANTLGLDLDISTLFLKSKKFMQQKIRRGFHS